MNTNPPDPQTVTYWATSILISRTAWFSALTTLVGILALPEVMALIPLRFMPALLALTGVITFVLRVLTVRPVAFIPAGWTAPVEVPKIEPVS